MVIVKAIEDDKINCPENSWNDNKSFQNYLKPLNVSNKTFCKNKNGKMNEINCTKLKMIRIKQKITDANLEIHFYLNLTLSYLKKQLLHCRFL